jgi:hypothetical protein
VAETIMQKEMTEKKFRPINFEPEQNISEDSFEEAKQPSKPNKLRK